ncbi:MAG: AEC family transporter [Ruminococcaceae bacterium]|nr:AEC family transporter [Oscillospiraceae bacterium]
MLALKLACEISLLVFLGFFLGKKKLFPDNFEASLSKFIINVSLPCLIVVSLNKPFDPSELSGLATLMIMSLAMTCAFFVLGQIGYTLVGGGSSGRLVRFGTTFCNYTYFGMPVMEALYGSNGLFLYNIFSVPIRVVIYFFASVNFSGSNERKSFREILRLLITAPTAAVVIGMVLYLCNITLPDFLKEVMDSVGSTSSPLGMILCGLSLSHIEIKNIFKFPKAFVIVLLRCIIAPVLTFGVLYFTNIDTEYIKIAVVYAALPMAAMTTSYIIEYEKNEYAVRESAVALLVSTLVSIVTLPLFTFILDKVFA